MKTITPEIAAAIAGNVMPALLAHATFADGFERRIWAGDGDLAYDGHVYTGRGDMIDISRPTNSIDGLGEPLSFVVSGYTTDNIEQARQQLAAGGEVRLHVLLLSDSGMIIPLYPDFVRERIDSTKIDIGASGEITLQLTLSHRLTRNRRPKYGRVNDVTHRRQHPDDTFYEDMQSLAGSTIPWANISGVRYT